MHKWVIAALAILALAIGGYFLFFNKAAAPEAEIETSATQITVSTSTLAETNEDYVIDAEYPQFGIASIDTAIRSSVETGANTLKAKAVQDKPFGSFGRAYEYGSNVGHTYVGTDIVSAKVVSYFDTGGAHPMPAVEGYNFYTDGREVTLDTALSLVGLTLPQLAQKAKTELSARFGQDIIAPEGADATAENYGTFYINESEVIFVFQPYQVAPYAAGAPEVKVARVK